MYCRGRGMMTNEEEEEEEGRWRGGGEEEGGGEILRWEGKGITSMRQ